MSLSEFFALPALIMFVLGVLASAYVKSLAAKAKGAGKSLGG